MQSLLGYWLTRFLCLVLLRLALYELEGGAGGWRGRRRAGVRRRGGDGLAVCPSGTRAASEWGLGTGSGRSGR
jgi:hypothetical protein